jgi:hypothetical protein
MKHVFRAAARPAYKSLIHPTPINRFTQLVHKPQPSLYTLPSREIFGLSKIIKDKMLEHVGKRILAEHEAEWKKLWQVADEKDFANMVIAYHFHINSLVKQNPSIIPEHTTILRNVLNHPDPKNALYYQSGMAEIRPLNTFIGLLSDLDKLELDLFRKFPALGQNTQQFYQNLLKNDYTFEQRNQLCEERLRLLKSLAESSKKGHAR